MRDFQIIRRCIDCGQPSTIVVEQQDYYDWCDYKLMQEAMPYLTADERELLISGVCGKCFDKLLSESEENPS